MVVFPVQVIHRAAVVQAVAVAAQTILQPVRPEQQILVLAVVVVVFLVLLVAAAMAVLVL